MTLPQGKVTYSTKISNAPFIIFQSHPEDFQRISQENQSRINKNEQLKDMFFHPDNISYLQNAITQKTSNRKYTIKEITQGELERVMEHVFSHHPPILFDKISLTEKIQELNRHVLQEIVGQISKNIHFHDGYIKQLQNHRVPHPYPKNTNVKGTKTLPAVTSIYG
jgi:hypothetical protein